MNADMPRLAKVGAALRKTTGQLALELSAPTREAPDWSEFEWRAAMAVVVMHGVSALLADSLRWRGPALWQAFLAEQLQQGIERQRQIEALLARIDAAAVAACLPAVALKGSVLLGLYRPGERPMGDIDLLVRDTDFEAFGQVLLDLGFSEGISTWRHRTYMPPGGLAEPAFGEHADNPLKIELHTRIMERMPLRTTEITEFPKQARPGLNPYPSTTALMRHLLLHAAGNLRTQSIRLIQLHDIVLLAKRMEREQWQELLDDEPWWVLPPLALVERHFPGTIPPMVTERAAACCPWLLRRWARRQQLADASLSSLWIPAFPGWQWAQSGAEALRYFAARVAPDRETRALMHREVPLQPALNATAWHTHSQLGKILFWLLARAPRVQTIYSVQRALVYRPRACSNSS